MAIFDFVKNLFKKEEKQVSYILAEESKEPIPSPKTTKTTPKVPRVSLEELELCYINDPICFNSINKATQMILSAGYEIIGEGKEEFKKFFDSIGKVGEDVTFDEILEAIYKYQMIYGNAYIELVYNKRMDRIVDLVLIDPKKMDYAKDSTGNIVLDKYGKPIGYVLTVPFGYSTEGKSDPVPKGYDINLGSDKIFLLPERICHFKLYTYGDRFYGLGLIEPAYKSILYKHNIEEAQSVSIDSRGLYPLIAYVGDEKHHPTPQSMKEALDLVTKIRYDRGTAAPYWYKVEPIEVKQSEIVQNTLEYLRINETASLGMPAAFATGSGEATNRATLNNQQVFLEFTLNDIVYRTLSTIKKYIINRICQVNKFKPAEIKWGDIGAEEINDKAKRLISYIEKGVLTPTEIKSYAIKSEGLGGLNADIISGNGSNETNNKGKGEKE